MSFTKGKYAYKTIEYMRTEAKRILREADDAGFNVHDALRYLELEDPELVSELRSERVSLIDCWRAMRVQKIDEEDKRKE